MADAEVTLSVIVPTVQPWPSVRAALDGLRDQVSDAGGEVVVCAGEATGVPDTLGGPFVTLNGPADVFALRALGAAHARGEFVSFLEDHVYPPPGWASAVIDAFARHAEAEGIVWGVTNGAPKLVDRASFLVTWGPLFAPLREVPTGRCPPPGAIAYRRRALPDAIPQPGWLEYEFVVALREAGRLAPAPEIAVAHVQHLGLRAFVLQYHAGRAFAGLDHEPRASLPRRKRLADSAKVAATIYRQTRDAIAAHPEWQETRGAMAVVAALAGMNALGQVVGVLAGPGKSTTQLE